MYTRLCNTFKKPELFKNLSSSFAFLGAGLSANFLSLYCLNHLLEKEYKETGLRRELFFAPPPAGLFLNSLEDNRFRKELEENQNRASANRC